MKPSFAQRNAHTEDYGQNPPNKILQHSRLTSSSRIAIVLASGVLGCSYKQMSDVLTNPHNAYLVASTPTIQ